MPGQNKALLFPYHARKGRRRLFIHHGKAISFLNTFFISTGIIINKCSTLYTRKKEKNGHERLAGGKDLERQPAC